MEGCNKNILVDVFYHGSPWVKIFLSVFPWEVIQEEKCVKVPGKIVVVTGKAPSVSHVSWVEIPGPNSSPRLETGAVSTRDFLFCHGTVAVFHFKDMLDEHGLAACTCESKSMMN